MKISPVAALLIVTRIGWIPIVAVGLLVLSLALYVLVLPALQNEDRMVAHALEGLRTGKSVRPAEHELATRFADLRAQFAKPADRGELLKSLFKMGNEAGIALTQAEYRWQDDPDCGCVAMRVSLPVKGGYVPIRRFIDNALASLPSLALDEISFRRSSVKTTGVEGQLRFTLYFDEG